MWLYIRCSAYLGQHLIITREGEGGGHKVAKRTVNASRRFILIISVFVVLPLSKKDY